MQKEQHNKRKKQNWLHKKYIILIRNEENFQEQSPLRGQGWQLLLIGVLIISTCAALSALLSITVYNYWQDNYTQEAKLRKQIVDLSYRTDSLMSKVQLSERYAGSIRAVFNGDSTYLREPIRYLEDSDSNRRDRLFTSPSQPRFQPMDQQNPTAPDHNLMTEMYFFPPIQGYISDHYSIEKAHYGVDLLAPQGTSVQATAAGIVILSSWTQDTGHVIAIQHDKGFTSFYKHNAVLLKKVGDFVEVAEPIAIIGNTGELSTGPHLHFEIWQNGKSIDPHQFIDFH